MDAFIATGMAHIFGVLGWLGAVVFLSLNLLSHGGSNSTGELSRGRSRHKLLVFLLMAGLWVCLSGLFYTYEQVALQSDFKMEFWWMHSMLLTWIFFTVVIFLLDPLVFGRNR